MNSVNLAGTIVRDPEQRNENAPANFMVETKRSFIDKEGELREFTDKHKVTLWGKGRAAVTSMKAGDLVSVSGSLQTRSYDRDGQKVWTTEVNASAVQLLAGGVGLLGEPDAPAGGVGEDQIPFAAVDDRLV